MKRRKFLAWLGAVVVGFPFVRRQRAVAQTSPPSTTGSLPPFEPIAYRALDVFRKCLLERVPLGFNSIRDPMHGSLSMLKVGSDCLQISTDRKTGESWVVQWDQYEHISVDWLEGESGVRFVVMADLAIEKLAKRAVKFIQSNPCSDFSFVRVPNVPPGAGVQDLVLQDDVSQVCLRIMREYSPKDGLVYSADYILVPLKPCDPLVSFDTDGFTLLAP